MARNKVVEIRIVHTKDYGFTLVILRETGKEHSYKPAGYRLDKINYLLDCCFELIHADVHPGVGLVLHYIPKQEKAALKPIKTRPITGVYLSSVAGVWSVEFWRKNANQILTNVHLLDADWVYKIDRLLKQRCEVAEVNLHPNGGTSIWFNVEESK